MKAAKVVTIKARRTKKPRAFMAFSCHAAF